MDSLSSINLVVITAIGIGKKGNCDLKFDAIFENILGWPGL